LSLAFEKVVEVSPIRLRADTCSKGGSMSGVGLCILPRCIWGGCMKDSGDVAVLTEGDLRILMSGDVVPAESGVNSGESEGPTAAVGVNGGVWGTDDEPERGVNNGDLSTGLLGVGV
jgi:hypothetical protein